MLLELLVLLLFPHVTTIHCNVGAYVYSEQTETVEGTTVKTDCAIFHPQSNQTTCKKFPWKVANYEKMYFACGNCHGTGSEAEIFYEDYNISKFYPKRVPNWPFIHAPDQTEHCKECYEDLCFSSSIQATVSAVVVMVTLVLLW